MKRISSQIKLLAIFTIISSFFFSCKEDKVKTSGDVDAPIITVFQPDANDIFGVGDTFYLSAHIEDISQMQDFTVNLIYSADTVLLWPEIPGILGNLTSYDLDDWVINTVAVNENAIIRFEGSDKHSNVAVVDVAVQLEL